MKFIRNYLRLSRPIFLLGVALLYALGVGIAHYLGVRIRWDVYVIGQLWVSLLQLSATYLNEYFNAAADRTNPNRTYLTGGSDALGPGKIPPIVSLVSAMVCLTVLASFTVLLISKFNPPLVVYFIITVAFFAALFYSTPPVRLESSGYGELIISVLAAFFVPYFAFVLQDGSSHRLLAMTSFPLVTLHLSMLLAFEFPDYATDIKFDKRTLLVRIGWQTGMLLHNILILWSFLLLLLASVFGYPRFAIFVGMMPLPLGIFQIFQMRNIAKGKKPNWTALTTGAAALFMLAAYLLAFSFWTN